MLDFLATLRTLNQSQNFQISLYFFLNIGEAGMLLPPLRFQLTLLLMSFTIELAHRFR